MAALRRQRTADAARASHGGPARLPGRWDRSRSVEFLRVDLECPWLSRTEHHGAPGVRRRSQTIEGLAPDAQSVFRPPWHATTETRDDPLDGQLRVRRAGARLRYGSAAAGGAESV